MSNLLEITGDDIKELDDANLRNLIGLLSEEDVRQTGRSAKIVTWGGHQDAPDGGIDVDVDTDEALSNDNFVPRKNTRFQVKKSALSKGDITAEMRPKGVLREEIKSLISTGGAYIIVSSESSTTHSALKERIDAMRAAVKDEDPEQKILFDFYDGGRIATWVRSHASMILWVRNKIGRDLNGWYPYGNWVRGCEGINEEYELDGGIRMRVGTMPSHGMSLEQGLVKIRNELSAPGVSIRLVGLSGVGKTKLVQTLFDNRIGGQVLNPLQAIYTDTAFNSDPDPLAMAKQLIYHKSRVFLIVDNCPPDLHRMLTQVCYQSANISLLTVEYDVGDDQPEETKVIRLDVSSESVIKKIIKKRYGHISDIDAQTIAHFSGGNARIAIALANTLQIGEQLSGFRDEVLFDRLFQQRNEFENNLLISAQVLSLVCSFNVENVESETSELNLLASIVDKSASYLYRDVQAIKDRELIQSRGNWRATLPQAIADYLARHALNSIPKDKLVGIFINSGSEHLIKSFSRRLGYLHDSSVAVSIASEWLQPNGWLGKLNCNFNAFQMSVFKNIAPIDPEKVLLAIERSADSSGSQFTSRENHNFYELVCLLWHLAYEPHLFYRSAKLICRFALSENKDERHNSIRNVLKPLFYIYLSGTHASVEERAKIIQALLDGPSQNEIELGIFLLDATLETIHFSSICTFEFGARPRDYGYHPATQNEIVAWYETFIAICTNVALSDESFSNQARNVLSNNLRWLWTRGRMFDALERAVKQIHEQRPWKEGWLALLEITRHDSKGFNEDTLEKLHRLETILKPSSLLELARVYIFSPPHKAFNLESDINISTDLSCRLKQTVEETRKIGIKVAQDTYTLNIILPDLFSTQCNTRLYSFGKGLAEGCSDKVELWQDLYVQFTKVPLHQRKTVEVLIGFLSSFIDTDPAFYNQTLDSLINDKFLSEWLPVMQSASNIDQQGLLRLHKVLDSDNPELGMFKYIGYGGAHKSISDDDLASLLKKILSKKQGIEIVIEILKMRFDKQQNICNDYSQNLMAVSREALSLYQFSEELPRYNNLDYDLALVARISLCGEDGTPPAFEISNHFLQAMIDRRVNAIDYPALLCSIASTQPEVFLDVFLKNGIIEKYIRRQLFYVFDNPIDQITVDKIILWCDADPEKRYPLIASSMTIFSEEDEKPELEWKPIVNLIFNKAPNLNIILEHFAKAIWVTSGSGTRAAILQKRLKLLHILWRHENAKIAAWSKMLYSSVDEVIKKERKREKSESHTLYTCFE